MCDQLRYEVNVNYVSMLRKMVLCENIFQGNNQQNLSPKKQVLDLGCTIRIQDPLFKQRQLH